MKQLKNSSRETDDMDIEEDIDEFGELNGESLVRTIKIDGYCLFLTMFYCLL